MSESQTKLTTYWETLMEYIGKISITTDMCHTDRTIEVTQ